MAVRIRLKKLGRRHRPYFRICVMDSRTPRDGKAIEEVGTYDPMIREKDKRCTMKSERIDYWLGVGALPTEKVKILIDKYKGKVPEVRIDKPVERVIPEFTAAPPKRAEAPAEPAEAEATQAASSEEPAESSETASEESKAPEEKTAPAAEPASE